MAKKKRFSGHYCKVCNSILSNEKFSGGGHSSHICKNCSKLSIEERDERRDINRIYGLYRYTYLSKANRLMLEGYLKNKSEKVRLAAKSMMDEFSETARFIREDEELCEAAYEKMEGKDTGNNELIDDEIDEDSLEDLYRLENKLKFDIEDDELPF